MNKYKYLTRNETIALDLLINNIKNQLKDELLQVKLFGSKSRGDFQQDSDIDLLLVVRQRTKEILDKLAELHLDIDLKYDPHISLIIFSEYEYKQNEMFDSPFIKSLKREGIPV